MMVTLTLMSLKKLAHIAFTELDGNQRFFLNGFDIPHRITLPNIEVVVWDTTG